MPNTTLLWGTASTSPVTSIMLHQTTFLVILLNKESYDWLSSSMMLLSLWTLSMTLMIQEKQQKMLYNLMLGSLSVILVWTFQTTNVMKFYVGFEMSLLPTAMLIMLWGYQPERVKATFYLIMYTVMASLPLLAMLMSWDKWSLSSDMMMSSNSSWTLSSALVLLPMTVKLAVYGLHTWLPKAHVEAPVAGSMVLAAILLKLGSYGALRLIIMSQTIPGIWGVGLAAFTLSGSMASAMLCLWQTDFKILIAYASVSHMSLALASLMVRGETPAIMLMVVHGVTSSGLFLLAYMSYSKTSTRNIYLSGGLSMWSLTMGAQWMILLAANMGTPPSMNFTSEVLMTMALLATSQYTALAVCLVLFMTVAYSMNAWSLFESNKKASSKSTNETKYSFTIMGHVFFLALLSTSMKMF